MPGVLAALDGLTMATVAVKALVYAATLLAAGAVLALVSLRSLDGEGKRFLARLACASALASAGLSLSRLPLQAAFLGGSLQLAFDPALLRMVAEAPLGVSVALRLCGLALVPAILLPHRAAHRVAALGALAVCASFALRGHALAEPRLPLGLLISLHLAALAFWIGAMASLRHAARHAPPRQAGALAQEFGGKGMACVAAVVAAGALTLWLFGVATPGASGTAYGQIVAVKLLIFVLVLALAAANKLALTPHLMAGAPRAASRLRRSIGVEGGLVGTILLTTALLTTMAAPPV